MVGNYRSFVLSGMGTFIINNKVTGVQARILLYLALNKDKEVSIKDLSLKLNETQKIIIEEITSFKSPSTENKVEEKKFIICFKESNKELSIINDTKYPMGGIIENKDLDSIKNIFNFWKTTCNKSKAKLDAKRKSIIQKSLKEYGEEDCKKAILGCSKTLWNMGYNDSGEKLSKTYLEINLIFRNADKIETFMENSTLPDIEHQVTQIKEKLSNKKTNGKAGRDDWLSNRLGVFDSLSDNSQKRLE